MNISLIIRCYNEEQHIGRLLDGIMQQTLREVETILVDSGSTDGTLSIVSQYPSKVLSIRPDEFSFGRSLNLGCRAAQGELLVFASAHVFPLYDDWLERLLAPFHDPKVALTYGRQCGDERTRYSERQIFAKWFPTRSNSCQDNPFCNNANAAVRRSIWEQLPYDETLTGLEDLDWAARVMRLGYRIAYVAEADVVHLHNESYAQVYNRYRREAIALKQIFPSERFGIGDLLRLLATNVVADAYHAWREGILKRYVFDILMFRLMHLWGTYRGFAQRGPLTDRLKRKFFYPNGAKYAATKGRAEGIRTGARIEYAEIPAKKGRSGMTDVRSVS
jgi:rhamnosyltransferase